MPPYTSAQKAQRAQANQPRQYQRSSVQPSAYQQAIIDWLIGSTGNAIVEAKAGSGKTSTLCMLSECIPNNGQTRAAFLAFNRSIADELKSRLPNHVLAATWHSVTVAALRRMPEFAAHATRRDWVNKNKVHMILDSIQGAYMDAEQYRKGVVQLVGLLKANNMAPNFQESEAIDLVSKYDIEFDSEAADGGVEQGIKMARHALTINNAQFDMIDFDDMLYLAAQMGAPLQKYSHVFLDEAQDTNKVQRVLLAMMTTPTSRIIAVGDQYQAIYGFRGADSDAMNNIRDEFDCVTFPLSISYRCPRKVIQWAQRIVPDIEAREGAPEGTVKSLPNMMLADFTALDLVLCRNTAPLITLAFRFLRAHKPVKVMGRDIGEQLVSLIQKMRASDLEQLADKLDEYTNREVEKAISKRQEQKAERLTDQRDSIMAIIEGLPEDDRSVYAVIGIIRDLFTDNGGKATTLSTIHKAKGCEAHTVYILDGHLLPSKWAKQPWQQVQEKNLQYVAITRSLDSLYCITSEGIQ